MRRISLLLLLLLILPLPALAAEKVALVIGIGDYAYLRPLANVGNDARLMHRTLTGMGFDAGPAPLLDLDHGAMLLALRNFAQRARDAKYAVIHGPDQRRSHRHALGSPWSVTRPDTSGIAVSTRSYTTSWDAIAP